MNNTPEYFDRITNQVDVLLLATKHVVVVGVGTVGSPVAEHLAKDGVGSFLFIDGDRYEEVNRVRHVLPPNYVGKNKAEAMRKYLLSEKIPGLHIQAIPQHIDSSISDYELDALLDPADLIIAGTGERDVQRRLGRRALALDIPAIFPALYPDGGGEVFIQTSPQSPCFFCWDGWRTGAAPVRGAEALGVDAMSVIQTAIELSLGVFDPGSRYEELTLPDENDRGQMRRQLFMLLPEAPRTTWTISRRRDCPSCAVGPSPLREEATNQPVMTSRPPTLRPPVRPPPTSTPDDEPIDKVLRALLVFVVTVAFATVPFVIMKTSGFEKKLNEGGNALVDIVSFVCGLWGTVGLVAVVITFVALCMTIIRAPGTRHRH